MIKYDNNNSFRKLTVNPFLLPMHDINLTLNVKIRDEIMIFVGHACSGYRAPFS